MKKEDLNKANEIKKEIDELEHLIWSAEKVWTGKIIKRDIKYIFKSNAYGMIEEQEYRMNTNIKNKVLDVLREHLNNLYKQLEDI